MIYREGGDLEPPTRVIVETAKESNARQKVHAREIHCTKEKVVKKNL